MAKLIVLTLLFFFILRFIKRMMIAPVKLAEEIRERSQAKSLSNQEKDISSQGKIVE